MTRTRILALALFASVALNLFIGGLLVGRHGPFGWHPGPPPHGDPHGGPRAGKDRIERMEAWLMDDLSEDARPVVRRLIAEHRAAIEGERAEHHEARERVRATLAAEPFDPDAYRAALDAVSAAHASRRDGMHAFMIELAAELSAEDRKALAARPKRWRKDK